MGINKATTKVFTCYRRQRKDGTYPIKLRVTYKGDPYEYALKLFVTEQEDKQLESGKFGRSDGLKKINNKIIEYLSKANTIIDKMPNFSVAAFEKEFLGQPITNHTTDNLIELLVRRSNDLRKEGRVSYADSYQTTANSLKEYQTKILVNDVDVNFLIGYEHHLLHKGNSSGCVGVYMRNIRTILNDAIDKGIASRDNYPFGRKKYCIPQQRNNKTALAHDDVTKILNYQAVEGSSEEKARDFWLFMYLTNGLNMKDVALLKVGDLKPQLQGLTFFRAKTHNTTKHNRIEINVWYDPRNVPIISKIVTKHGTNSDVADDYLFPILYRDASAAEVRRLVQNFTRYVNKNMTKISKKLGLDSIPKTNVARHTFVTMVVNKGDAPLTDVKDLVGHRSITTTAGYVNSLPINKRKEYSGYLIE